MPKLTRKSSYETIKFDTPDGSVYRVPTTKQKFVDCNKKGATLPTKTLTAKQIEDIKKEVF